MSGFTKEIIAKTFTEILDEKPMSKVTVRDIVERCGVNRNTFYYHFRDIPDVVEFVLKRKWDEIQEAPQEKNSILECMEEMASLVRDNRKLMLNVYKSVKRDTFLIYMNDVILYIITEYFKKNRNKFQLEENEIQILVRYYKCLFVGILIEWLDHGLKEDLGTEMRQAAEVMEKHRELLRSGRARGNMKTAAIVGYTNAGKSTLLNKLTGSEVLSEDKLFATLDPTTRLLNLKDGQQILLTDTVGFIHKLPHHLIEAFRSTLEEAKYADYIIHVVDSSNPQAEMQMHVVYETLKELGVMGKKIITLFNKQDAPGASVLRDFKSDYTLKVSARTGEGLENLNTLLEKLLAEEQIYVERLFPYQEAGKIQLIREFGQLISEEYTESGIAVKARVPREIYPQVV